MVPALWNGELQPLSEVRVSVLDRAYLFGDAVYEVLRVYAGQPFLLREHEDRLRRSLDGLGIDGADAELGEKIARLVAAGGPKEGLVYVQISRGEGPRSHVPPKGLTPNELLWLAPVDHAGLESKWRGGVSVLLCEDLRWGRCDVKSVNLLGNVLAAGEAKARGCEEALLVDRDGFVTEGAHTTFFGVRGSELVTTPLSPRILPGITRDFVIGLAKEQGLKLAEAKVKAAELGAFDEVFLTGTVSEIFPVVKVDGAAVGDGRPGPVTQRLHGLYRARVPR